MYDTIVVETYIEDVPLDYIVDAILGSAAGEDRVRMQAIAELNYSAVPRVAGDRRRGFRGGNSKGGLVHGIRHVVYLYLCSRSSGNTPYLCGATRPVSRCTERRKLVAIFVGAVPGGAADRKW